MPCTRAAIAYQFSVAAVADQIAFVNNLDSYTFDSKKGSSKQRHQAFLEVYFWNLVSKIETIDVIILKMIKQT